MRRSKFQTGDGAVEDDAPVDGGDPTPSQPLGSSVPSEDATATDIDSDIDSDIDVVEGRISELQRDLTSERDKLLRLAAEFDNYRKRMMRERLEAEGRGKAELVKDILEPMDDIARFAHVDPAVTDSTTIVEGVAMVERKLEKTLRAAGLEVVNPVGEAFDPAKHEAVGTEAAESPDEEGTIGKVYQVGYTFMGQLLRPARVVVRQHAPTH